MHPDLPDDRLLQRPAGRARTRRIRVGGNLRFFGDGWQISKKLDGRRYWRMPVMDGEFVCEDLLRHRQGRRRRQLPDPRRRRRRRPCAAAEAAVAAIGSVPGVDHCRSPAASSAAAARSAAGTRSCRPAPTTPTARRCAAVVEVALPEGVERGLRDRHRRPRPGGGRGGDARRRARGVPAGRRRASRAGNYGGKLGPFHLHLHKLLGRQ